MLFGGYIISSLSYQTRMSSNSHTVNIDDGGKVGHFLY